MHTVVLYVCIFHLYKCHCAIDLIPFTLFNQHSVLKIFPHWQGESVTPCHTLPWWWWPRLPSTCHHHQMMGLWVSSHMPLGICERMSLGYVPRNKTAGSYGKQILTLTKQYEMALQNGCTIYVPISGAEQFLYLRALFWRSGVCPFQLIFLYQAPNIVKQKPQTRVATNFFPRWPHKYSKRTHLPTAGNSSSSYLNVPALLSGFQSTK